ncbi:MAG: hypothetical protein ACFFBD_19490 [Candidatus Hodarchaeota archaeon]
MPQHYEKNVRFKITAEMLKITNDDGQQILEPGEFIVSIGESIPSKRTQELECSEAITQKVKLVC